jgi:peptidoglycan/LPS O-acetylase OafA/YrhL
MLLGFTTCPRILLLILSVIVLVSVVLKMLGADLWANYLSNINFLMIGCVATLYWNRLKPICRGLSVRSWLTVVALLIACVGLLPNSIGMYAKTLLYPPLIGLLVLGTPIHNKNFKAFSQSPLLAYLGKISYTVYLWQKLATAPYPTLSAWYTVLFVLCTWMFAIFLHEYFERPLINLGSRWSDVIKQRGILRVSAGFTK